LFFNNSFEGRRAAPTPRFTTCQVSVTERLPLKERLRVSAVGGFTSGKLRAVLVFGSAKVETRRPRFPDSCVAEVDRRTSEANSSVSKAAFLRLSIGKPGWTRRRASCRVEIPSLPGGIHDATDGLSVCPKLSPCAKSSPIAAPRCVLCS
jgi:hypothetical protein